MEAAADAPVNKGKQTAASSSQEAKKPGPAQKAKSRPQKKPKPAGTGQPSKAEVSTPTKGKPTSAAPAATPTAPVADVNSASAKRKRRKKEAASQAAAGEGKSRDGSGGAAEDPIGKIKLKVVVRKLPPNLPEGVFWKAVSPWISRPKALIKEHIEEAPIDDIKANVEYAYFVPGKLKDGSRRGINNDSTSSHTPSRAYIQFAAIEALIAFHKGFNGHLFRDSKGSESIAVVEFAPFQRMPSEIVKRKKIDSRQGTIEEHADYKTFVTSLEEKKADANGLSQAEKTDAQLMNQLMSSGTQTTISAEKAKHTPLLDHLRAQHSAKAGSAALKNARSYLNRNNNAYAAATGKGAAASSSGPAASKDKLKVKGKGKVKAGTQARVSPANADPSIPTGPKALRKGDTAKGPSKAQATSQQQQNSEGVKSAPPKGPKSKVKVQGGGNAVKSNDSKPTPLQTAVASKADVKSSSAAPPSISSNTAIPTGPAADRGGSTRGRGGRRGGRGRGGAPPSAASNGNR